MEKTICIKNTNICTRIMNIAEGAVIVKGNRIEDVVGKEQLAKLNLPKDTLYIDLKG